MELLQLQYFSEVVRQKSVTKAAQLLHISQPALSQTIRRLENELGVKLFEKSGKGIQLTANRFHTVEDVPSLAMLRPFEQHVLHEMRQSTLMRPFVAGTRIDGIATVRDRCLDRQVHHAQPVG